MTFFSSSTLIDTANWPDPSHAGKGKNGPTANALASCEAPHQPCISMLHCHLRFITTDTVLPTAIPATSLSDMGSIMALPSRISSIPCGATGSRSAYVSVHRTDSRRDAYGQAHLHRCVGPNLKSGPLLLDLGFDELYGEAHGKLRDGARCESHGAHTVASGA